MESPQKRPIVSIVSISYNQENYISEALESWLSQETDFSFEIIIGDDSSKDNTIEIIEAYQKKNPGIIKLLKAEKNQGHQKNLYNALLNSRGDYIAICAGDDFWIDKKKLQKQYDFIKNTPDCKLIYSNCIIKNELDSAHPKKKQKLLNYDKSFSFDIYDYLNQKYYTIAPTSMIKRFNFESLNLTTFFSSTLEDEYIFSCLLKDGGRAYYINEITACYRMHPKGINSQQHVFKQLFYKLSTLNNLTEEFKNDKKAHLIITQFIKSNIDRLFNYSFEGTQGIDRNTLKKLFLIYYPSVFLDYRFYYNWYLKKILGK